jgi:hypothetical protein
MDIYIKIMKKIQLIALLSLPVYTLSAQTTPEKAPEKQPN